MTARLLFVGDIHLGRRPSRLPEVFSEHGLRSADLSPVAAWRSTVEQALRMQVDAVVLAGDVVDRTDDRFEAYAPLRSGVQKLVGAGISVCGVAGNHDVEALPRLAQQIPDFRLLGADGHWETLELPRRGHASVRLLGWSFPTERVRRNPLASLRFEARAGAATLGVLHCDVDGGSSPYAPVPRAALRDVPVDGWFLGHIHRPDPLDDTTPTGYLGSLVGLDPGEVGRRGPWLVEVEGPGAVRAQPLALAPLRYERIEVELPAGQAARTSEDVEDALFATISRGLIEVADRISGEETNGGLRAVACRIGLRGALRHHPAARSLLERPSLSLLEQRGDVLYGVESVVEPSAPDLDLEALSIGDDPPALLARRVLALERGGAEAEALLLGAERRIEAALSARSPGASAAWSSSEGGPGARARLVETLIRAGTRRLETLLAQREQGTVVAGGGR